MPGATTGKPKVGVSTQQYLDIYEVRDDIVIMKDGTLRAVLLVSSINFALKSEDEQNAIISSYVRFINSINFMVQIIVQSRELDINDYLSYLKQKEKEQTNRLLREQTSHYIDYIKELTSLGKIMNKYLYVVVPYSPLSDSHKSFFEMLSEAFKPATAIKLKEGKFAKYREALKRRIEVVMSGLASIGVSAVQLDTQGLIELYYKSYNPETARNQDLVDIKKLRVEK
ncbi:MAG: hypothetical protein MUF50_00560 [Planctomycetes bacterium]|jgi:hypothetical protein|nr:hypothetical protein [Planctomycetota bacterium]